MKMYGYISIPRALTGPDDCLTDILIYCIISIPRALTGPDGEYKLIIDGTQISIPRALTGPDCIACPWTHELRISIPRALTGPDQYNEVLIIEGRNFNPQGPHRPRRSMSAAMWLPEAFQSPGPSQAPTRRKVCPGCRRDISIPRALAGPD